MRLGMSLMPKLEQKLQLRLEKVCKHCGAVTNLGKLEEVCHRARPMFIPCCWNCDKPLWDTLKGARMVISKIIRM